MALFTGISSFNRCEILALIDALSLALSEGLSADDLNAAGNFLASVGSVMSTFASLTPTQDAENKTSNSSGSQ